MPCDPLLLPTSPIMTIVTLCYCPWLHHDSSTLCYCPRPGPELVDLCYCPGQKPLVAVKNKGAECGVQKQKGRMWSITKGRNVVFKNKRANVVFKNKGANEVFKNKRSESCVQKQRGESGVQKQKGRMWSITKGRKRCSKTKGQKVVFKNKGANGDPICEDSAHVVAGEQCLSSLQLQRWQPRTVGNSKQRVE